MSEGTAQPTAEVNLKRAWGLIKEVEKVTEEFRQRAIQHDAQIDQDQPFVAGLVSSFRGAKQLKQEKTALVSDLQLASQEIEKVAALNPDATIEGISVTGLRAIILYATGQIEMIWGKSEKAKEIFSQSLQIAEGPDSHYMLGIIYQSEYNPAEALKHFERCLELEPNGELSVSAFREANAMRNYKKQFRGSWQTFGILILVFFPAAIVYFIRKRK